MRDAQWRAVSPRELSHAWLSCAAERIYSISFLTSNCCFCKNQVAQFYKEKLQFKKIVTFLGAILKIENALADLSFGMNYSLK
jgi:hypothetical protein